MRTRHGRRLRRRRDDGLLEGVILRSRDVAGHAFLARRQAQLADQGVGRSGDAAHVHAGVIGQVGLEERDPRPAGDLDEQGQVDDDRRA